MSVVALPEEAVLVARIRTAMLLPAELHLFVEPTEESRSSRAREVVRHAAALSNLIDLKIHSFEEERALARRFEIRETPTVAVGRRSRYRCRFHGAPESRLYPILLEDLVGVSRGEIALAPSTLDRLASVSAPLRIRVYVDPTSAAACQAVRLAHQMALASPHVVAESVSVDEFPALARAARVRTIPTVVVNGGAACFEGDLSEPEFLERVLEALSDRPLEVASSLRDHRNAPPAATAP